MKTNDKNKKTKSIRLYTDKQNTKLSKNKGRTFQFLEDKHIIFMHLT